MPRLKKEVEPLRKLLCAYEVSGEKIAAALGLRSITSGTRRKRNPEKMSVAEWRTISRHCGIPIDEIRAAL